MLTKIKDFTHIVRVEHQNSLAIIEREGHQSICLPVLVMTYVHNGDLFDLIDGVFKKNKYRIPIPICKRILYQILMGLKEIHQSGIIHRDIKPQNLLFDENFTIKIADFGLSALSGSEIPNINFGTTGYKAP